MATGSSLLVRRRTAVFGAHTSHCCGGEDTIELLLEEREEESITTRACSPRLPTLLTSEAPLAVLTPTDRPEEPTEPRLLLKLAPL